MSATIPYGSRNCDKCGEVVPRYNSMMLLEELTGNLGAQYYETDRHLFAVEEPNCPGSPSRAQYIEGQPRDTRDNDYHPERETNYREAYAKMIAANGGVQLWSVIKNSRKNAGHRES